MKILVVGYNSIYKIISSVHVDDCSIFFCFVSVCVLLLLSSLTICCYLRYILHYVYLYGGYQIRHYYNSDSPLFFFFVVEAFALFDYSFFSSSFDIIIIGL